MRSATGLLTREIDIHPMATELSAHYFGTTGIISVISPLHCSDRISGRHLGVLLAGVGVVYRALGRPAKILIRAFPGASTHARASDSRLQSGLEEFCSD